MKKEKTKNAYQTYGYTVKAPNKNKSGVKPTEPKATISNFGGKKP